MVLELTDVSQAPMWLQVLVYMQMYQWYLLAAILPTVYFVIVKLFGFPLMQRWSQEIVVILYPTKVKFAKLTSQYQPYFRYRNGIYWLANPLSNVNEGHKFKGPKKAKRRGRKAKQEPVEEQPNQCLVCGKAEEEHTLIANEPDYNSNQVHVYTHAINQPVYAMERRTTKVDEILSDEHNIKSIPGHGIWIMRDFKLHFHRHWQLVIDPSGRFYKILPVEKKQQFNIGFYHTLGVVKQVEIEVEKQVESETGGGKDKKLMLMSVTNQVIVDSLKYVQEYHNYSANTAYRLIKRLKVMEDNFYYWVSGGFNPILIVVLGGAAACVALVLYVMHGSGPSGLGPMPK